MKKLLIIGLFLSCFGLSKVNAAGPNVSNLISSGTSSTLLAVGPGTLFNIVIASGAAGEYAVCYDSASASGITTTLFPSASVPEIARVFVAASNTTTGLPSPAHLYNFTNGLACIQSVAERTQVYWRQPN